MKFFETFFLAYSEVAVVFKTAFFAFYLCSFVTDYTMERALRSHKGMSYQIFRFITTLSDLHRRKLIFHNSIHQFLFG